MTAGTANWSFTQDDFTAITESLQRFLGETKSLCALLVDRSGQLVTTVGDAPGLDTTSFATLTAADYSANDQLAKLVGETDFSSLRLILYGASPIPLDLVRQAMETFKCDFEQVYGMTETTGAIFQLDREDHDPVSRPALLRSCGTESAHRAAR